jgi:S-adenosylmethionine:tRNA ribosyltransferase-isomerase
MNTKLTLSDFDYTLPSELIAQEPVSPRDHARLMTIDRATQRIEHKSFYDCIDFIEPGDVVIVNNSKVIPARLKGQKSTGGKIEIFLLRQLAPLSWECLVSGKQLPNNSTVTLANGFTASLGDQLSTSTRHVTFNKTNITSIGEMPLPPYITSTKGAAEYQTVYAKTDGSVAAPTAGLHFTDQLLNHLKDKGIIIAEITLHVGLGTFAPVKTEDLSQHVMHAEFGSISPEVGQIIAQAKHNGHKIIAIGTTVARTLEAFHGQAKDDWIDLFITPGYQFNTVDRLITNFHLPKSTLLMLVSAFMTKELLDQAYQLAIQEKYRFYSFGDAMMII